MRKVIFILTITILMFPYLSNQTSAATPSIETQLSQLKDGINQVILATTNSTSSTNATISYYHKQNGKWVRVYSRMSGVVGKNGLTKDKKEGDGKTPIGVYSLTSSFGFAEKPPGVKLPYTKTNSHYYWIDDASSSDYNKMIYYTGNADQRWKSYERLTHPLYSHALVIDYNTNPIIKGKGSAIFLHTRTSQTQHTLGCVAIYKDSLVKIMQQLDPSLKPHIIISDESNLNKTISEFAQGISDEGHYFSPTVNIPVYKHMTGTDTIGTLYKGEVFPIIEDKFINWYQVKVGSTYGYIKKEHTNKVHSIDQNKLNTSNPLSKDFTVKTDLFVKANITGTQITIGKIKTGLSYPIVNESAYWYQIDFLGRIGYVWKANTTLGEGFFSPMKNITVYKHMTGTATIGTLYKDEIFPIIEDKFVNWYQVKIGNTFGYIKKNDTRFVANASVPSLNDGTNDSSMTVRAIADLYVKQNISGQQITFGKINIGEDYPILEETEHWYEIDFLGRIGYVWKYNADVLQ